MARAGRQAPCPFFAEYWLDDREGELILRPRLPDVHKLYIEPTTGCNLDCRTCIRHAWSDPTAKMSLDTFRRIRVGMAELPDLKRVIFTGFGEALSHPNLLEMIEQVRQRDLAVTVGSNGLLLTPEKARELVRLGVDRLVVSVDGAKPETYADVRGAMLSEVLGNLRRLNEIKAQLGSLFPALGIEFVALQSNLAELGELTGLAARLNASRVLVSNVLPYTEAMRDKSFMGTSRARRSRREVGPSVRMPGSCGERWSCPACTGEPNGAAVSFRTDPW